MHHQFHLSLFGAAIPHYAGFDFQRRIFSALKMYLPFLNMNVVFDDARLRGDLGTGGPSVRPARDYLGELVELIGTKAALKEAALP